MPILDTLVQVAVLGGCVATIPLYWWLLATPFKRRSKQAGKAAKPPLS